MTLSTTVFKVDTKGKIRTWQYEVVGDSWRTIAGLQDGKKVISEFTKCVPASQPTAELQAQFEADAEMKKKLKRDYHLTVEGTAVAKYFKPMLAEKYDPTLVQEGDMVQPKLDGIRCIATKDGLRTRKGEVISSCPHISEQLKTFFTNFPNAILDGELYNHEFKNNFNELASIIRKKTPDAIQIARAGRDIEYHVYDLVYGDNLAVTAIDRNVDLHNRMVDFGWSIQVVPTTTVSNHEEVIRFFEACVRRGYEGAMVRTGSASYEQKRTRSLMKVKDFQTAEFPVVSIEEGVGNWAGYGKRAVCRLPDGRTFGAGVKGDQPFCKELLTRDVKIATIQFFELTPDGVPRFPIAVDFDRPDA